MSSLNSQARSAPKHRRRLAGGRDPKVSGSVTLLVDNARKGTFHVH